MYVILERSQPIFAADIQLIAISTYFEIYKFSFLVEVTTHLRETMAIFHSEFRRYLQFSRSRACDNVMSTMRISLVRFVMET